MANRFILGKATKSQLQTGLPNLFNGEVFLATDTKDFGYKLDGVNYFLRDIFALESDIPANLTQLNNDAGFITSAALTGYATQTWVNAQGFLKSANLNGYATETWVTNQGYAKDDEVVKLTGKQTIAGRKDFSDQIHITKSESSAPGLVIEGTRANARYINTGASGGVAALVLDGQIRNTANNTSRVLSVGMYGGGNPTGSPTSNYMYLDSRPDGSWNNATLKVDSQNRVGIAIESSGRPTQALDVNGKIRMREATAAGDAADIVTTKGYVESLLTNYVLNETGKGLSTNDFTNALLNKLNNIEEGAQVNTVTSVAGRTGAITLTKADVGLTNVPDINTSTTANITDTTTKRFVTDTEKSTWNSKLDSSALNGYATQTWVNAQGFLKSANLNGYATQVWANERFIKLSGKNHILPTDSSLEIYGHDKEIRLVSKRTRLFAWDDTSDDSIDVSSAHGIDIKTTGGVKHIDFIYDGTVFSQFRNDRFNIHSPSGSAASSSIYLSPNGNLTMQGDSEINVRKKSGPGLFSISGNDNVGVKGNNINIDALDNARISAHNNSARLEFTSPGEVGLYGGTGGGASARLTFSNSGAGELKSSENQKLSVGSKYGVHTIYYGDTSPYTSPDGTRAISIMFDKEDDGNRLLEVSEAGNIFNKGERLSTGKGLKLLRDRPGTSNLTFHTDTGITSVGNQLNRGDTIIMEVSYQQSYNMNIETVMFTLSNISVHSTSRTMSVTFSKIGGNSLEMYTFSARLSGGVLTFDNTRRVTMNMSGSTPSVSWDTFYLYIGRIWKVES